MRENDTAPKDNDARTLREVGRVELTHGKAIRCSVVETAAGHRYVRLAYVDAVRVVRWMDLSPTRIDAIAQLLELAGRAFRDLRAAEIGSAPPMRPERPPAFGPRPRFDGSDGGGHR